MPVRTPRTTKISSTKYLSPGPDLQSRPPLALPDERRALIEIALTLKWEMFRSCSRSQILLPRYASSRKRVWGGSEAAAWRAGQAAWHGWGRPVEWAEVSRGECLAWVRVPMVTPLFSDKTSREGVPNDAQQRGVSLAGQNPGDVQASAVEKRWWSEETGSVLTINRYYRG